MTGSSTPRVARMEVIGKTGPLKPVIDEAPPRFSNQAQDVGEPMAMATTAI